jgi:hypothetical protein
MKKILMSLLLVASCLVVSAFALESKSNIETNTVDMDTETFAYMNLETAPYDMKGKILEARKKIIFSNSWVADGQYGEVLDADGKVKRVIPQFSDIFPGWEVPKEEITLTRAYLPEIDVWNGNVNFQSASSSDSTPFLRFAAQGGTTQTYISYSYNGVTTHNFGYTNLQTGNNIAYLDNMQIGEVFSWYISGGTQVGVRASTYGTTGYAGVTVKDGL